ncbi:MAG: carbohydrate-binding module family 14 protein [bacterium]|jgi:hypothetical protein
MPSSQALPFALLPSLMARAAGVLVPLVVVAVAPQALAQDPSGVTSAALPPERGCELVACPAENGEFSLHLRNPLSCDTFCKCDSGKAKIFKCPAGTQFNAELQVCDWPDSAKCTVDGR